MLFPFVLCTISLLYETPKRPPNVLFILADDQRFDTVRALGNDEIQTPNLDKLAQRGFVFRNAYCQGGLIPAVCTPSRTMLMTGRSLFRIPAGAAKNYNGPTLGGVFRQAGHATLFCGKRGNSFQLGNEAFETVHYDEPGNKKGRAAASAFMADTAIRWLRERPNAQRPFFVYLAPPVPHDPRVAPPEFMKLYDPAKLTLPKNFMPRHPFDNGELQVRDEKLAAHPRSPDEMKRHLADYYATVSNFDHHIGRVLDALKELKELDRTLIVFTSDQGLAVGGRHGLMGKQNLYEHFKSPLIVAGPGIDKGSSDALVYLFDLFPTLCDLSSLKIPERLEGASLKPILRGDKKQARPVLFAAYRDCQRMVRDERWKLIWYPKINRFQLFDLTADPWEINDLAEKAAHADKLAELKKKLAEQQQHFGDDRVKQVE